MDRTFLFHFLFSSIQHPFDFSACSVSLFNPFILCGKGHSIWVNSCFGERKFHVINYMYVATCSHTRIWLSHLLGRTLAMMVFSEYTKRRILFHQAKGYCATTVADKLRDEDIVVCRKGVSEFLSRVQKTCSTARRPLYIHKLTLLLYLLLTRFQHRSPRHLP